MPWNSHAGGRALLALFALVTAALPSHARILRVDQDVAHAGSGESWSRAIPDLQHALAKARPGDELWVAEGVYKPTDDETDQDATFRIQNGVALYGGFAGNETARDQRNWRANPTILSGDIGIHAAGLWESIPKMTDPETFGEELSAWMLAFETGMNDPLGQAKPWAGYRDNIYHVVTIEDADRSTRLDGFTVRDGSAWTGGGYRGGGILILRASPTIANCFVRGLAQYYGGAVANLEGSAPLLENSTFQGGAIYRGGAIYNAKSSPELRNVKIVGSGSYSGGGMLDSCSSCSPKLTNVQFLGNFACDAGAGLIGANNTTLENVVFSGGFTGNGGGGGMIGGSNSTFINVVFRDNVSSYECGGGLVTGGRVTLINCEFYDNGCFVWSRQSPGGGGLLLYGGPAKLVNVTFARNWAWNSDGGGLFAHRADIELVNTVFWNNRALRSESDQLLNYGGDIRISHSLIEASGGSGAGWNRLMGTDGGGNLDANPQFISLDLGDLRLRRDSPAIDAGDGDALPASILTDLAGRQRFSGAAVDMGAYESGAARGPSEPMSMSQLRALLGRMTEKTPVRELPPHPASLRRAPRGLPDEQPDR